MCCCEMGLKHDVSVSLFALSRHERYICVSMKVRRSCPMWNKRSHLDLFTFRTQVNWDDVVNFHHIYVNRCMCVTSLSDLAHHALPLNFLDTIAYQKMSCHAIPHFNTLGVNLTHHCWWATKHAAWLLCQDLTVLVIGCLETWRKNTELCQEM